jgi:hypothetical protein
MIILACKCKFCEDILFSRAKHDYRTCSCGKLAVNGGLENPRTQSWDHYPERIKLDLEVTEEELFTDWNSRRDEFGWVKSGKVIKPVENYSRKISEL